MRNWRESRPWIAQTFESIHQTVERRLERRVGERRCRSRRTRGAIGAIGAIGVIGVIGAIGVIGVMIVVHDFPE